MPYSVWSRGRLFGHSELAYARSLPGLRAGDFEPSELGHRLLPVILDVGPALLALHDAAERAWLAERSPEESEMPDDWPPSVKQSLEFADAVSLQDEVESLALELRDPDGNVVVTDSIWFLDTERLLARAREAPDIEEPWTEELEGLDDAGLERLESEDLDSAAVENLGLELDDDLEPWEPEPREWPRYQIFVRLPGAAEALRRLARPDG